MFIMNDMKFRVNLFFPLFNTAQTCTCISASKPRKILCTLRSSDYLEVLTQKLISEFLCFQELVLQSIARGKRGFGHLSDSALPPPSPPPTSPYCLLPIPLWLNWTSSHATLFRICPLSSSMNSEDSIQILLFWGQFNKETTSVVFYNCRVRM